MQGRPITDYIWLGLQWRYVQDSAANAPLHGNAFVLENIQSVLKKLERFGLTVTRRAANDLHDIYKELSALPQDARLDAHQAKRLTTLMKDLQRTLLAEALGNVAYIVTDKRITTQKLLESPAQLLTPGVFDKLPQVAAFDFREACVCVAFERPTAAAFHLLRGTEDVLRTFYRSQVRRGRVSNPMWGPMTEALRKRRVPPSAELLGLLDHIRKSFRNPTQHPDKIYDIQEAQDLFALCVDAMSRMVSLEGWDVTA